MRDLACSAYHHPTKHAGISSIAFLVRSSTSIDFYRIRCSDNDSVLIIDYCSCAIDQVLVSKFGKCEENRVVMEASPTLQKLQSRLTRLTIEVHYHTRLFYVHYSQQNRRNVR